VADVRQLKSNSEPGGMQHGVRKRATESQASEQALRLISQWPRSKTSEYADLVVEVFLNYSAEVIARCADPIRGIGATRPDGAPRRHPPSIGEIKYFCDNVVLDDRPKTLIAPVPPRPDPTAEDKARVTAKAKEVLGSLARAIGKRVKEDERAEAEARLAIAAAQRGKIEVSESLKRNIAGRKAAESADVAEPGRPDAGAEIPF
jgi:hypothetical protein